MINSIIFLGSGSVVQRQLTFLKKHEFNCLGYANNDECPYLYDFKFFSLNKVMKLNIDLLIINNYPYLIDPKKFNSKKIINFHSGLLPYFKGKSSNIWSYLNSQPLGYSVHFVNSKMDDGKILFKRGVNYEKSYNQTINNIHKYMITDLPKIIADTDNNGCDDSNSEEKDIFYSIKLSPDDGVIKNFTFDPIFYMKMFDVFGNGTGLFLSKNNDSLVKIINIECILSKNLMYTLCGVVVNLESYTHLISTKFGYLKVELDKKIKIGTRLVGSTFFENPNGK
jgi:methionyl-tRNA formyltransferase